MSRSFTKATNLFKTRQPASNGVDARNIEGYCIHDSIICPKVSIKTKKRINFAVTTTRSIITHSNETFPNLLKENSFERPGSILLVESTIHPKDHSSSWSDTFGQEFPQNGISFHVSNLFSKNDTAVSSSTEISNDPPQFFYQCESALVQDMEELCDPNIIVITRGPIPSLIAQYFLESRSMAGLVMMDPFLVPFSKDDLQSSAQIYSKYLQQHGSSFEVHGGTNYNTEYQMIQSILPPNLGGMENPRILRLEPGSVPMFILYSNQHHFPENIQHNQEQSFSTQKHAEMTSKYHSGSDEKEGPFHVPVTYLDENQRKDDNQIAQEIYNWIDKFDII